jgi:secreted trypsin-like serine protease
MLLPLLLIFSLLVLLSPGVRSSDDGPFAADIAASVRIVGGTDASGSYPYFVLWGGCGATLIHNDIALTAAHCSGSSDALVGARSRDDTSSWTNVDRVVSHPDYDPGTFGYDIAVFRLGGWFEQSTVSLNGSDSVPNLGASLTILGFGGGASELQQGSVEYIAPSICAERWREEGYTIDSQSMICAGNTDADACSGTWNVFLVLIRL